MKDWFKWKGVSCTTYDLTQTAECFVQNEDNINAIAVYLTGGSRVRFACRPEDYYNARIVNQIPFAKVLRGFPHRTFSVNFHCKPFLYLNNSPDIVVARSEDFVTNPGFVSSEPVITIEGSGDIELFAGLQKVIYLIGVNGSITIDTR